MTAAGDLHFDVAIIGAGPAGTTCAALLARKGIQVLLCDKASFPREKICGDCVNPRCWDFFTLLGVADEVAANSENVIDVKVIGRSGRVLNVPFNNNLSHIHHSPFIAIKRSRLDSLLLNRAIADGATFYEATFIESIIYRKSEKGSWQICLKKKEKGETFTINCATLIGADGRNSRVARLLYGIDDKDDRAKEASSDRIGVQFTVRRSNIVVSRVMMFLFDGGYGGIVGVNAHEVNVAMVVSQNLARLALTDVENFIDKTIHSNQHMRRAVPRLEIIGDLRTAFPITPRIHKGRFPSAYLIGDAYHISEPFTGEGIYFAMKDGARTAQEVSKSFGLGQEELPISAPNRFWNHSIFSPILQRGSMTERILALGFRYNSLVKLASKAVFP